MIDKNKLFDFLYQLIDIQIEKYVNLTKLGIGPDARMNGQLVIHEINELLEFADKLLMQMEQPSDLEKQTDELLSIASQIKFYLEQEKIRADAGWLLDDNNNFHSPDRESVTNRLTELKQIIGTDEVSTPQTMTQKQCEHDSYSIAHYVLGLAKAFKANPDMTFKDEALKNAQIILKRNATTRYCKEEISSQIDQLYEKYDLFFKTSPLEKSRSKLSLEEAYHFKAEHKEAHQRLLNRYQQINPDSILFSPDNEQHAHQVKIAIATKPVIPPHTNWRFFGIALGLAQTIGIALLVNYAIENYLDIGDECPWRP